MAWQESELIVADPPQTVIGAGVSDEADAETVSLAACEVRGAAGGVGTVLSWLQAKVGNVWFDLPHDMMLKGDPTAATDIGATTTSRNINRTSIAVNGNIAIYKHLPFDTVRLAYREVASGEYHGMAARFVGK